jgi:2-dehydropantoate 2-reductase
VQLVSALKKEVIAAGEAQGHAMPPDLAQQIIPHTLGMGHYHSSMKVDRNEGRAMEIEAIFGEPLRQARDRGVDTPILAMVYEMLSIIDARRATG